MKTNVICFAIASALLLARPALAADGEYGTPGTIEVGGSMAIVSQSEDPEGGETIDIMTILLQPAVGYFVSDGFQLIGQLPVQNSKFDAGAIEATLTTIGLGAGAAYLFPVGGAHVGPQFVARYSMTTVDYSGAIDLKLEDAGPGANVAVVAKVPVGGGGVIGASLFFDYTQVSRDVSSGGASASDDGTITGIGTAVTFNVFF